MRLQPVKGTKLVTCSDRVSRSQPDPSITYTGRLKDAGIEPSAGSVGESQAKARAGTIYVLFQAEAAAIFCAALKTEPMAA